MERKEQILEKSRMRRLKEFLNGTMEKEEVKEILEEVRTEDIKRLVKIFREVIKEREGRRKTFKFTFEAKGYEWRKPYVARLKWYDGELERDFKDLVFEKKKRDVYVSGEYKAASGDIIEKRLSGADNDERYWYFIDNEGKEVEVAHIRDRERKKIVINYLKGEVTVEELLESVSAAKK